MQQTIGLYCGRLFWKNKMPKPVGYAAAADLVEAQAKHEEPSLRSALMVLVAGLRWKDRYDGDDEEPALIADAYALVFPMHKHAFRELANTLRALAML